MRVSPTACAPCGRPEFPDGKTAPARPPARLARAAGLSGNNPVLGREIPLPGGPVSLGLGMGLVRLFFQSAGRVSGT